MKKKLFSVLLAASLAVFGAFGLVGCAAGSTPNTSDYDDDTLQPPAGDREPSEGLEYSSGTDFDGTPYDYYYVMSIGDCKDTHIVIPSTYNDSPVIGIWSNAFKDCTQLTSVYIPDSIEVIDNYAFCGCTGLTSVYIPDSVKSIKGYAFCDCTSLKSVRLPKDIKSINNRLFQNCTELKSINIPNGVESIDMAFGYCSKLTSITIPDSVTKIAKLALDRCSNLTSITVGSGNEAYLGTNNCLIEISSKTLMLGCKNSVIPTDGSVTTIGDSAFWECSGLTSVSIPDSVTNIEKMAFCDCTGLESLAIGNGLANIGEMAFIGCSGLTSITVGSGNKTYSGVKNCLIETASKKLILGCKNSVIPTDGSVTAIGEFAFENCIGLTNITIPDSVIAFCWGAFRGCSNLTSINYKGTMAQWKDINKDYSWCHNTGNFVVQCTDGQLDKFDNEIT